MTEGREAEQGQERTMKRRILLIINCIILSIGASGGPLITRLYFIHGGHRVWLTTFLQTAGFPILLLPLIISYILHRRRRSRSISTAADNPTKPNIVSIKPPLFVASVIIGVLTGLSNYLNSFGFYWLPVSTSTLVVATQLAFTAVFAFLLVKQKFTAYSVNAVVLLTIGAGVLALHGSGDRPKGESTKQYVMGFVMTLLAAALYGFVLPLVELVYKKTKQSITYSVVLEFQLLVGLFATLFSTLGMIVTGSFKAIATDARHFGLVEANYYIVLVGIAIIWQLYFLGAIGVIFCASSLFSGIMIAVLIPITQVLAVILYKEKFQVEKGISLVLCLWGFVSYFYGEFKQFQKNKNCNSDTMSKEVC